MIKNDIWKSVLVGIFVFAMMVVLDRIDPPNHAYHPLHFPITAGFCVACGFFLGRTFERLDGRK